MRSVVADVLAHDQVIASRSFACRFARVASQSRGIDFDVSDKHPPFTAQRALRPARIERRVATARVPARAFSLRIELSKMGSDLTRSREWNVSRCPTSSYGVDLRLRVRVVRRNDTSAVLNTEGP